ncbi:hypothetical protein FB446DRAFT_776323 [Lentinula raphanica]|nr:hypothetical protein FB446DRAFT_776323 [Lentinula raphanica]
MILRVNENKSWPRGIFNSVVLKERAALCSLKALYCTATAMPLEAIFRQESDTLVEEEMVDRLAHKAQHLRHQTSFLQTHQYQQQIQAIADEILDVVNVINHKYSEMSEPTFRKRELFLKHGKNLFDLFKTTEEVEQLMNSFRGRSSTMFSSMEERNDPGRIWTVGAEVESRRNEIQPTKMFAPSKAHFYPNQKSTKNRQFYPNFTQGFLKTPFLPEHRPRGSMSA